MEKGGDVEPATRAASGMCDRFLTFLAKNLSVSRMKSIADQGPRSGTAGGGHPPPTTEGGDDDGGVEEDEFAIPIERAEFDFQYFGGHGDGAHSSGGGAPTILEESAATTTTTTRDVPDEQKDDGASAAAAAADGPAVPAMPAVPAVEETKVRRTVTIKDDRPAQEAGGASAAATATVERKKSLFRKRQASSVGGGEDRVPKRIGLRPRMPQVLRVPSNINERSSTFIEERKKSFGSKPAAPPEK